MPAKTTCHAAASIHHVRTESTVSAPRRNTDTKRSAASTSVTLYSSVCAEATSIFVRKSIPPIIPKNRKNKSVSPNLLTFPLHTVVLMCHVPLVPYHKGVPHAIHPQTWRFSLYAGPTGRVRLHRLCVHCHAHPSGDAALAPDLRNRPLLYCVGHHLVFRGSARESASADSVRHERTGTHEKASRAPHPKHNPRTACPC